MINKKEIRIFLVVLAILAILLSSCRPQQPSTELSENVAEVRHSDDVVNTLSGVRAKSVVKALNENEKIEIKAKASKANDASSNFGSDVNALLKLAKSSKNPALLDAALRLKNLYSGNSIDYHIDNIYEQSSTGGYDETLDGSALQLSIEVAQAEAIFEEVKELAEGTGDSLLLNHIKSMEEHLQDLSAETLEVSVEVTSSISVSDWDEDGVPDNLDTDPDGDGDNDDLNGDGIMTLDDADFNGDGQVTEEDFDLDGDGIHDFTGSKLIPIESDVNDWNSDGIADIVVVEYVEQTEELQKELQDLGFTDTDADGFVDFDEYKEQTGNIDVPPEVRDEVISFDTDYDDDGLENWLDADADGDGVENHEDDDLDGDGINDDTEYDTNNDGEINEEDFKGREDELHVVTYTHLEEAAAVEENYGKPADTDTDGTPDYSDDDIDNDGKDNIEDTDDDNDKIEDAVEFYTLEKLIEGGVNVGAEKVGDITCGDYFEILEGDHKDYENVEEFMRDNVDEYREFVDQNPDLTNEMDTYFSEHPEEKEHYEQFLLDNAEFYDSEARYYVQHDANVLNEHPEFYVMPAVSAYYETEELPEDLKAQFEANPELHQQYEAAKEHYEQYKQEYITQNGEEAFEQQYNEIYGEEGYWGNTEYSSLYEHGEYQHTEAWSESGAYVGGYTSGGEVHSGYFGGEHTSTDGVSSYGGGGGLSSGGDAGGHMSGGDAGGHMDGGGTGYAVLKSVGWY